MIRLHLFTKNIPSVGVFGELFQNGEKVCVTVEREWLNNEKNVSCIPAGVYSVKPHDSPRFGKCYSLENKNVGVTVYGPSQRTHCLIHTANFPNELQGCIALGLKFHPLQWGVGDSRKALDVLSALLGNKEAVLTIERH